jgi:ResB-like family
MHAMNNLVSYYRKVELFFGNLKFAVVIILLFAVALGYGTFMESYHGTEYANRLIYKSFWFMGIQFGMFLSILFATLIRLPMKKHLYGFYVIHLGLITLFVGSYITYQSGVDGTVTLTPNLPSREISINEDELKIQFPSKGKEVTVDLPFTAFAKDLGYEYEGIKLKTFLPFAENKQGWIPVKVQDEAQSSTRYRLYNDNFGEFITLSLHPQSDFNNTQQLGPLNVHYMPSTLVNCFSKNTPDGLIVWNGETTGCISPMPHEIKKKKNVTGQDMIEVSIDGQVVRFLPQMSPLPLDDKMELSETSPYRVFSKKLFEKSPHLFLFGKSVAFFDKNTNQWSSGKFDEKNEIELPWMGFRVKLLEHRVDTFPTMVPEYIVPVQDNGQVISGNLKAVEVQIGSDSFWIKSNEPVAYNMGGDRITFALNKKSITLPYELVLDRFKMDTDPGTQTPASFESFVTLFKGNEGSEKHHVYMNHPLKYQDFTFYQASYFQTQEGPFGSVLSVNFDPGRFWKYLGSLLLVLGSIWHFVLRKKPVAKPGEAHA